jgi:hypothetical protein
VDWDRTDSWQVRRIHEPRKRLRAHISDMSDLARVRTLMPELRDVSPAEIRARVRDGELDLGEHGQIIGTRLIAAAKKLGLRLTVETDEIVRHEFFNRTRNVTLHVDDADEAARVAEEMVAAGVPMTFVEID